MSGYIQVDERRNRKMESEMIQALQTIADNIQATSQPGWVEFLTIGISFVSMAISGIAIWFAIRVADKQNKVSLFEKRFDCYTLIQKMLVCGEEIKTCETKKEIQVAFRFYLDVTGDIGYNKSLTEFICILKQLEPRLVTVEFLFRKYDVSLLQEMLNVSIELVCAVAVSCPDEANECLPMKAMELKRKYCTLCAEYQQNYVESMEKDLKLGR